MLRPITSFLKRALQQETYILMAEHAAPNHQFPQALS